MATVELLNLVAEVNDQSQPEVFRLHPAEDVVMVIAGDLTELATPWLNEPEWATYLAFSEAAAGNHPAQLHA